jgi:small subunit ribosomal protein S1
MSNSKKSILDKLAEEVDKISDKISGKEVGEKKPVSKKAKVSSGTQNEELDETPMGKLLAENDFNIPQVGDVVEGFVIDISSSSLLLDLGMMGTGIVIGKEIKDGLGASNKLKRGDSVSATITDLENDEGYIELSIREASYERAWDDLESKRDTQEVVTTKILDANKGGLMVEVNGITGFLPVSQLSSEHYPRVEDGDKNKILELLKKLVNQEIFVKILDTDRVNEKLIVSEKAASSEKEKKVISELKVGDVIEGDVSGVVDFGAFIKFLPPSKTESMEDKDKLEGLVHISELAWQLIDNPKEIVKTGDKVKAKIIGIDDTRISLSMKALANDPWAEIGKKYKADDIVQGKVDKINPFGAFVYLDKDIHGLAHVSEFKDVFPDKKMDEILKAGETYNWKILSIEPKEHRMGLMFIKEEKKKKEKK